MKPIPWGRFYYTLFDTGKYLRGKRSAVISNLAQDVRAFTSNVFLVDATDTGADGLRDEQSDPGTGADDGRTVVIDPGNEFDVVSRIEDRAGDLDAVVLTHTHPDHVGNVDAVVEAFDVNVWGFDPEHPLVDHPIADGEEVRLGADDYRALHTPGHIDDHLCFYSADAGVLFAGDLVFANGGFGRTDLPEGDRRTLVESVDYVLETVDEDLRELHTGHGPSVSSGAYDHLELAARAARMG